MPEKTLQNLLAISTAIWQPLSSTLVAVGSFHTVTDHSFPSSAASTHPSTFSKRTKQEKRKVEDEALHFPR